MTRERMDPLFAVFNGHVNDADKRARAFMAKRCPTYLARVEALEREGGGIMHLFDVCGPTWGPAAARRYIQLVTGFVNEDCDSDRLPKGEDSRSEAECGASQSGDSVAGASPNLCSDNTPGARE